MDAEHSNMHLDTPHILLVKFFPNYPAYKSAWPMHYQKTLPLDREQCQVISFGVSIWENTPWLREIPWSMKLPDKKSAQLLNTWAARRGSHNCKMSLTDTLREILFDVILSPVPDLHSIPHKRHYTGIFKTMGSFLISVYKLKDRQIVSIWFSCYLENRPEGRKLHEQQSNTE